MRYDYDLEMGGGLVEDGMPGSMAIKLRILNKMNGKICDYVGLTLLPL
jgi:hypothetical protein